MLRSCRSFGVEPWNSAAYRRSLTRQCFDAQKVTTRWRSSATGAAFGDERQGAPSPGPRVRLTPRTDWSAPRRSPWKSLHRHLVARLRLRRGDTLTRAKVSGPVAQISPSEAAGKTRRKSPAVSTTVGASAYGRKNPPGQDRPRAICVRRVAKAVRTIRILPRTRKQRPGGYLRLATASSRAYGFARGSIFRGTGHRHKFTH